jgi:hypothetical protein
VQIETGDLKLVWALSWNVYYLILQGAGKYNSRMLPRLGGIS